MRYKYVTIILRRIKKFLCPILEIFEKLRDLSAAKKINRQKSKKKEKPIKVAFILQYPEGWDIMQNIYYRMIKHVDFYPFLIIVPKYDSIKCCLGEYGDERTYFESFGYENNVIYAWNGRKIISIREFDFDYVFYQRPYDDYLPIELKSSTVAVFSRVCYVSYAFCSLREFVGYNREFFRNVYICFMESQQSADYIKKKISPQIQKACYVGYPAFEGESFHTLLNYRNVLWTPRWTYDKKVGGSHFFQYKDDVLKLVSKGFSLTIRPHPLAFENFVRMGYMTKEEVEEYKNRINAVGAFLDSDKELSKAMNNTDILITDISSIIIRFFLTGKPIIYCECNMPLVDEYEKMKECMYIAKDWNDVEAHLDNLKSGNDYLRERREALCKQFGNDYIGSSERVVEEIRRDFDN